MIDSQGYRANVGIVLHNDAGQLFWCKRAGQDAWQFPQGGITQNESPEDALYRELKEETGLSREDVEVVASSKQWLKYRLPPHLIRRKCFPKCIGQKQRWFYCAWFLMKAVSICSIPMSLSLMVGYGLITGNR